MRLLLNAGVTVASALILLDAGFAFVVTSLHERTRPLPCGRARGLVGLVGRGLVQRPMVSNSEPLSRIGRDDNNNKASLFSGYVSSGRIDPSEMDPLPAWRAALVRAGMLTFIAGMCLALPLTLLPQWILYKVKAIDRVQKERWALMTGSFCARWLLRLIPFCTVSVIADRNCSHDRRPEPTVWVCNHTSMLDVFLLMALDHQLRGPHRRPLKILYWKQLEDNPVTRLLFKQCGFIPVQMAANGAGEDNEYDKSSFKPMLKSAKQAFEEGFDLGVLPEGQLNPHPENGVLPIFTGAFTLARMSKRPIRMMALHGVNKLWSPASGKMECTGRQVRIRCYPYLRYFPNAESFKESFVTVVGDFGRNGQDLLTEGELRSYLSDGIEAESDSRVNGLLAI